MLTDTLVAEFSERLTALSQDIEVIQEEIRALEATVRIICTTYSDRVLELESEQDFYSDSGEPLCNFLEEKELQE